MSDNKNLNSTQATDPKSGTVAPAIDPKTGKPFVGATDPKTGMPYANSGDQKSGVANKINDKTTPTAKA